MAALLRSPESPAYGQKARMLFVFGTDLVHHPVGTHHVFLAEQFLGPLMLILGTQQDAIRPRGALFFLTTVH
jgi:hypothetical protein